MNTVKEEKVKFNVSIQEASEVTGKSQQYFRVRLQRGLESYGNAQQMPRKSQIYILYIPHPFLPSNRKTIAREIQRKARSKKYWGI